MEAGLKDLSKDIKYLNYFNEKNKNKTNIQIVT